MMGLRTPAFRQILFAKQGTIKPSDKGRLSKAGFVVVEVENLDDARLVRPSVDAADLPAGDLLAAIARGLIDADSSHTHAAVSRAICAALSKAGEQS